MHLSLEDSFIKLRSIVLKCLFPDVKENVTEEIMGQKLKPDPEIRWIEQSKDYIQKSFKFRINCLSSFLVNSRELYNYESKGHSKKRKEGVYVYSSPYLSRNEKLIEYAKSTTQTYFTYKMHRNISILICYELVKSLKRSIVQPVASDFKSSFDILNNFLEEAIDKDEDISSIVKEARKALRKHSFFYLAIDWDNCNRVNLYKDLNEFNSNFLQKPFLIHLARPEAYRGLAYSKNEIKTLPIIEKETKADYLVDIVPSIMDKLDFDSGF